VRPATTLPVLVPVAICLLARPGNSAQAFHTGTFKVYF